MANLVEPRFDGDVDRLVERFDRMRVDESDSGLEEKEESKNWGIVPFASTESEADEYIGSYINAFYKLAITDYGKDNPFDYYDAKNDCLIAFVRHFAQLHDSGATKERIQRDLSKIWQTYIGLAKTIEIADKWVLENDDDNDDDDDDDDDDETQMSCLNGMRRFAASAVPVKTASEAIDLGDLREEAPQVDGRIQFGDGHAETWSEQARVSYIRTSPWLNLRIADMEKALDTLTNDFPGDEEVLYHDESCATTDKGDCGIMRNLLTKEITNHPPNVSSASMAQYKSAHAFAALLTEPDTVLGQKRTFSWPFNKTLRLFRDVLEEDCDFKAGDEKHPDIGVLSSVMPIWMAVMSSALLAEVEEWETRKEADVQKAWMPLGKIAAKKLKGPPIMSQERWNLWKDRTEEISTAADENTVKKENKLKFWKRLTSGQPLEASSKSAEDTDGKSLQMTVKHNMVSLKELMNALEGQKARVDQMLDDIEKRLE